jgi:hypothetical protein
MGNYDYRSLHDRATSSGSYVAQRETGVLRPLLHQLRQRFEVAAAEVAHQDACRPPTSPLLPSPMSLPHLHRVGTCRTLDRRCVLRRPGHHLGDRTQVAAGTQSPCVSNLPCTIRHMSVVDEIKERLDLTEIIGRYVQLQRSGRYMKGLCPFHSEKTPSFFVFPDDQRWRCFGCGKGGDLFTFMMEHEGWDFHTAWKNWDARPCRSTPSHPNPG